MEPPIPPETKDMILDSTNPEHRKILLLWLKLGVVTEINFHPSEACYEDNDWVYTATESWITRLEGRDTTWPASYWREYPRVFRIKLPA